MQTLSTMQAIRHWCKEDVIDFTHVATANQLADFLTKVLARPAFERCRAQCVSDIHVDDVRGTFVPA